MTRRIAADDVTIPNLITILRFFLVPAVVLALLSNAFHWALACFVIAGVSDGVDGYLARALDQKSELGAWLDAIADKLLLVSVFIVLGFEQQLPLWLVVAAVSRDGLIVGAVMLSSMMGNPVEVKPLYVSKANTAVQIVLVVFVLSDLAFDIDLAVVREVLVAVSGLLTIASAAAYLLGWLKHMGGYGKASDQD